MLKLKCNFKHENLNFPICLLSRMQPKITSGQKIYSYKIIDSISTENEQTKLLTLELSLFTENQKGVIHSAIKEHNSLFLYCCCCSFLW